MSVHYSTGDSPSGFCIDDEGVCDPLWGIGKLAWSEVREVFCKRDGGRDYICIVVRDRDALKRRQGFLRRFFSGATRSTGFGDLSIDSVRRGLQADQIVEFASGMVTASQKKGPNQPPQRNAGSRPSSGDSPGSETSSSLGPRG